MRYIVVDTEDTGWGDDPERPIPQQVIEVAALRVTADWQVEAAFYRRWRPTLHVQPKAAAVNGYTPEAWANTVAPCVEYFEAFAVFVKGCKWVGSLPAYDQARLEETRAAVGGPRWELGTHRALDVGPLGAPLCTAVGSSKGGLEAIVAGLARLGLPVPPLPDGLVAMAGGRVGAHSAMGDAWSTLHVARVLYQAAERHWRARAEGRAA